MGRPWLLGRADGGSGHCALGPPLPPGHSRAPPSPSGGGRTMGTPLLRLEGECDLNSVTIKATPPLTGGPLTQLPLQQDNTSRREFQWEVGILLLYPLFSKYENFQTREEVSDNIFFSSCPLHLSFILLPFTYTRWKDLDLQTPSSALSQQTFM